VIIALLVLIVLILLFGAGVVKGWLANLLGAVLGFAVLAALIVTIESQLGEEAFLYVLWAIGGFFMALWFASKVIEARSARLPPQAAVQTPSTTQDPSREPVKAVWRTYADDIQYRFDLSSQIRAHDIYKTGDAAELEKFCSATVARTKPKSSSKAPSR